MRLFVLTLLCLCGAVYGLVSAFQGPGDLVPQPVEPTLTGQMRAPAQREATTEGWSFNRPLLYRWPWVGGRYEV